MNLLQRDNTLHKTALRYQRRDDLVQESESDSGTFQRLLLLATLTDLATRGRVLVVGQRFSFDFRG